MANNAPAFLLVSMVGAVKNIDEDTADIEFKHSHKYTALFTSNVHTSGFKYQQTFGSRLPSQQ